MENKTSNTRDVSNISISHPEPFKIYLEKDTKIWHILEKHTGIWLGSASTWEEFVTMVTRNNKCDGYMRGREKTILVESRSGRKGTRWIKWEEYDKIVEKNK